MDNYAGKKAVVTGGTHGMGLAMVEALLEGGAEVLLRRARRLMKGSSCSTTIQDLTPERGTELLNTAPESPCGRGHGRKYLAVTGDLEADGGRQARRQYGQRTRNPESMWFG